MEVEYPCRADEFEVLSVPPNEWGGYSKVYRGRHKLTGTDVALKVLGWGADPKRIAREVRMLQEIRDQTGERVVRLLGLYREREQVTLVFDFVEFDNPDAIWATITTEILRDYLQGLLLAISVVHASGIVHRDVKPQNFLYSVAGRTGKLIDFGLAEFEAGEADPDMPRFRRAGTPGFKAFEVVMGALATRKTDVWGAGVAALSLLARRDSFFAQAHDGAYLIELAQTFGSERLLAAARELGCRISLPSEWQPRYLGDLLCGPDGRPWHGRGLAPAAIDLLEKMVTPIVSERLSVEQALAHPFLQGQDVMPALPAPARWRPRRGMEDSEDWD